LINLIRFQPAPGRIGCFLVILLLLWLPIAAPAYWLLDDSNTIALITMPVLFGEFMLLLRWWGGRVYHQPRPLQSYGLSLDRRNGRELLQGLSLGTILLVALFLVEGWLGWVTWRSPDGLIQIGLEGLLISLGVGLGEELIFRGWLLDELQRDYSPQGSLWVSSLLFAALHFLKPIPEIIRTSPQFFGLVVLGLTLVWARRRTGDRLGLPIGLHAGLVWGFYLINVGELIRYTNHVPAWITGIDGNPLAGVTGLLVLGGLAGWMQSGHKARSRKRQADDGSD
jgi:hypothetical protein